MRKSILIIVSLCLIVFPLTFFIGCRRILGKRPIHNAAHKGDLKKVKKIIEKDPTQINIQDVQGRTPLYCASIKGHTEIVKYLLAHGADIELGNNLGERPLALAAKFGHYNTMKTLLKHGAAVNCKDKYGLTPLHEAILWDDKGLVNILLSNGADVNSRDRYANTPLHRAAIQNNINAAKALVEHGADVFAKNYYDYSRTYENWGIVPSKDIMNKTPKEIALERDFKQLARYLQTIEEEKKKEREEKVNEKEKEQEKTRDSEKTKEKLEGN